MLPVPTLGLDEGQSSEQDVQVSAFMAAFSWGVVGSRQSLWVGDGHHKCSEVEQQEISSALCKVAEGKESCVELEAEPWDCTSSTCTRSKGQCGWRGRECTLGKRSYVPTPGEGAGSLVGKLCCGPGSCARLADAMCILEGGVDHTCWWVGCGRSGAKKKKRKKKILGVVNCGTDTEKARTMVSFRGKN